MPTVALLGATGFVGQAVARSLTDAGLYVTPVTSPRLRQPELGAAARWQSDHATVEHLKNLFTGHDIVVCCAGDPDASARDEMALFGANAALPGCVAAATYKARVNRLVHVSSAVVQGSIKKLDESTQYRATSMYARSKRDGEISILTAPRPERTIIYRPPSVHSSSRRVTRAIYRIANSPLSSIIGPRDSPTPQAHISNVASAITHLCNEQAQAPEIVIHPWEGWSTYTFLKLLSRDKGPFTAPTFLQAPTDQALRLLQRSSHLSPNARRLQMLWLGQQQAGSWISERGWKPQPASHTWLQMAEELHHKFRTDSGGVKP